METLLFFNESRVFHQGEGAAWYQGQVDLLCPMLFLRAAAEREGSPGTLLSSQNPNVKMGVGQGEQGAFHPQNRNCGEQRHAKHECT